MRAEAGVSPRRRLAGLTGIRALAAVWIVLYYFHYRVVVHRPTIVCVSVTGPRSCGS